MTSLTDTQMTQYTTLSITRIMTNGLQDFRWYTGIIRKFSGLENCWKTWHYISTEFNEISNTDLVVFKHFNVEMLHAMSLIFLRSREINSENH